MSSIARARLQNAVFLVLALAVLAFAMYPGRFDGDAISAYRQGLNFYFTDATSVWGSVLMGVLADIARGPAPMFLLQLVLWIGGLLAFTDALIAGGHRTTGQAISLLAVTPLLSFDFFDVQKDALLSALLVILLASGTRRLLLRTSFTVIGAATTALVFLLALDTRHNAVFALVPMWFLIWPEPRLQPRRLLASAAAGLAVFAAAHLTLDLVNHGPLKSDRAHFAYSLIVYDLAGISVRTRHDASQGRLAGFLGDASRCYSPHEWDAFQGGACRPAGLAAQALMQNPPAGRDLTFVWAKAIISHPIAYAAHRARHFGCHLGLGCRREVQKMTSGWWPRPWDEPAMRVSAGARAIGAVAVALWESPLGSGALWLGVLAAEAGVSAWLLRRGFKPLPYLALVLAAAGFAYFMSYAVVGIADQMRYLHPVIFLAVLAGPLAVSGLIARWRDRDRRDRAGASGSEWRWPDRARARSAPVRASAEASG